MKVEVAFVLSCEGQAAYGVVCWVGAALWEEPRRAQSWAVLSIIEAHTWLVCVAVRRENVGWKSGGLLRASRVSL